MSADHVAGLVFGILALGGALAAAWAGSPGRPITQHQIGAAERCLARLGLSREPELVVVTRRLQSATERAGYRALAVVLTVLAPVGFLPAHSPPQPWLAVLGFPLVTLLGIVAFAFFWTQTLRRHEPRADGPHVAHGARPRVTDHVAPLAMWWPAIMVAACGLAAGASALHLPTSAETSPTTLMVVWGAGSLAEAAIVALVFWLAPRPQPAATAEELAVRDTLTGDLLSLLLICPVVAVTVMYVDMTITATFSLGVALWLVYLFTLEPQSPVRRRLFAARRRPPMPLAGS